MGSEEAGDARRRPVLASLTKYIPYEGIPHAGGQYVRTHYEVLRADMSVREIAPDTPLNRESLEERGDATEVTLVPGSGLLRSGRFKLLGDLDSAWAGSAVTRNIRMAFDGDGDAWRGLVDADLIEFQWSEMLALAPVVRARLPRIPLVGIAHDVITQRWCRAASTAPWPLGSGYRLAAARSEPRERSSFEAVDVVIVFSEKDARLVRDLAPSARTEVVLPGLGPDPGEAITRMPDSAEPIVLFTGALNRADNHNAVMWFLEHVWPTVLAHAPSARFVAAGAHPRPALQRTVERAPRAELTGFVDSLEPYYARASVFVAPLFTGAGVKFKTIDALLRHVPTVSTPVGMEGIEAAESVADIATSSDSFASSVVRALRMPDMDRARRAATWAEEHYGRRAFQNRLLSLYSALLDDGTSRR